MILKLASIREKALEVFPIQWAGLMEKIKTGDKIEVDGDNGTVRIIK